MFRAASSGLILRTLERLERFESFESLEWLDVLNVFVLQTWEHNKGAIILLWLLLLLLLLERMIWWDGAVVIWILMREISWEREREENFLLDVHFFTIYLEHELTQKCAKRMALHYLSLSVQLVIGLKLIGSQITAIVIIIIIIIMQISIAWWLNGVLFLVHWHIAIYCCWAVASCAINIG